ncbi:RDD family protein [Caulobacter sp.]|uniref:RDD family protein n=1 Tax=Caulobacter sp. TaxID=78 RepID=UPI003BAA6CD6
MDDVESIRAGFWRRILGFLIDGIVLGLTGIALGTSLYDELANLAGPTRLIGLAIGAVYFGVTTSAIGGSRTLGMRVTGLKVVSVKGGPLSLPTALWRAILLQAPFMLNGMIVSLTDPVWLKLYGVVVGTIVFGAGLAQILLLFFNRASGRLVHDLLSGAAVVRVEARTAPERDARGAMVAAGLAVFVSFAAMAGLTQYGSKFLPEPLTTMSASREAVMTVPTVLGAWVQDNTMTNLSGAGRQTTRTLIVTAKLRTWPDEPQALADQVGAAALSRYKLAPGQRVRVVLSRGYDIGIAQASNSRTLDYQPPAARPST